VNLAPADRQNRGDQGRKAAATIGFLFAPGMGDPAYL